MRTRNAETPKSTATKRMPPAKKSAAKGPPTIPAHSGTESGAPKSTGTKPPAKKSATKTPPTNSTDSGAESGTPKSTETKRASAAKARQAKANEVTPTTAAISKPSDEEVKASSAVFQTTPGKKAAVSGTKTIKVTKTVVKRTPARTTTAAAAKSASRQTLKHGETKTAKAEDSDKGKGVVDAKGVETMEKEESNLGNEEESDKKKESKEFINEDDHNVKNVEEPLKTGAITEDDPTSLKQKEPVVLENILASPQNEESKTVVDQVELRNEPVNMGHTNDTNEMFKGEEYVKDPNEYQGEEGPQPEADENRGEESMKELGNQETIGAFGDERLAGDDVQGHSEEAEGFEEECAELTAAAKERKIKKEVEIFVGGLDRDAVEEDVKVAFEKIGEVVDVRLHKNLSTNKNKGYAFVKFATKEQASRALLEMKNPVIHGKRCGTAPSEDNDTLFLGNICNTWTKEAIRQKLKEYGIEGVGNITLVLDAQHEGLSRGFAFLEFDCHADAMLAYKRLQKPDVIFGHPERTAKVAFAEPLREPDPEVMAQVKSVFVDGLPPHWDEDCVRERFKGYGEIERIVLARNMSTAKRKDFGFVDFKTHEAAVACIDGISNAELVDGNLKTRVKARLSNPLPKTQAVKGGMCGGFRIGCAGAGSSSSFGRGSGRGAFPFNRANFQRGRGFYQHGRGQPDRMGVFNEYGLDSQYPLFHGSQTFGRGGRRGFYRGADLVSGRGAGPAGPNFDGLRQGAADGGHWRHIPARRQLFSPDEGFDRPFLGRHLDDPYFYDDSPHGIKRPFLMADHDPDYLEHSRQRPRLDYPDPAIPFRGSHYRDTFEARDGLYSHDYYGSDYGGGAYSSFYRGGRTYGGGYYY